jgi:hypothetical protein
VPHATTTQRAIIEIFFTSPQSAYEGGIEAILEVAAMQSAGLEVLSGALNQ